MYDLIPTDSGSDTLQLAGHLGCTIRNFKWRGGGGGSPKTGQNILKNQNLRKKNPALQRKQKKAFHGCN